MSLDQRDKIIDDLLLKKPRGPKTKQQRSNVSEVIEHFGYSKEALFDLKLHDRASVIKYIRDRFFDGASKKELGRKNATVTRRSKRLWSRIETAVRRVKNEGGCGIYKVRESKWSSYGGPMGYLHAFNKDEAQKLANMFFGYVMTYSYTQKPYVEIVERGTANNLMEFNEEVINNLKESIEDLEKDITRKAKSLSTLQARLEAIEALQKGQSPNIKIDD